jgi:outer membrane protein OmpA-like peptidoglycan-associated protein
MGHGTRLTIVATVLTLSSAGCASDQWAETLFTKRLAEVDETLAQHGQRIDRVEGRVANLEVTLTETREQLQHSVDASATGPQLTPWRTARPAEDTRTHVAIIDVPFGFDRADLDTAAQTALASVITEIRERPGVRIALEGTTDPVGRYEYNVKLSSRRVAAVKRWLTRNGVDPARIVSSTSRGPLPDPSVEDFAKRRVSVKLMGPAEH